MSQISILPYSSDQKSDLLDLTLAAWTPVFDKTQHDVPKFVYDAFYPEGWATRQEAEVGELLDTEPENIWVAMSGDTVTGFIGLRLHPEDQMGEIYILAVSPDHQRKGIGNGLMRFAEAHIRQNGMKMIMVETIGDTGHAPARRAYQNFGFVPWPVARYFKEI